MRGILVLSGLGCQEFYRDLLWRSFSISEVFAQVVCHQSHW